MCLYQPTMHSQRHISGLLQCTVFSWDNSLCLIFNFYWSVAALQCCVGVCGTVKRLSCMYTYIPSSSPQSIEQTSLCNIVGSHQLSILCTRVYTCQSQPLGSSYLLFSPWCPYVCSPRVCFYFCFANKFVYIIFLDSTYIHQYIVFVFHFLTCFTLLG